MRKSMLGSSLMRRRPKSRPNPRPALERATRVACESLETRRMFVSFSIDGTSGPDSISISINGNDILYAVNGVSDSRSDTIFNAVEINGSGGDDTITIVETGANEITVNAGSGDDTINVALGANDLDAIDDFIFVNGDGNSDTLKLFDQSEAGSVNYTFTNGNQVARTNMPAITYSVEKVQIEGGSDGNTFHITDPTTAALTLHGNGNVSSPDFLSIEGSASEEALYIPSGVNNSSGSISFEIGSMAFNTIESVLASGLGQFTLKTPQANDTISSVAGNIITGTSGSTAFASIQMSNLGTMLLDVGTQDGAAGNDTITLNGSAGEVGVWGIDAGIGTNTLRLSGPITVDSDYGAASGTNLDVTVAAGGTTTFQGFQNLNRIELENTSTVQLGGSGTVVNTRDLAVVGGAASVYVGTNQSLMQISPGTFSIAAGCTLNKKGAGGLSVSGAQSHGTGALFEVLGGTATFLTDAGTPSTRHLVVDVQQGTMNFNSTQHLAGVATNFGDVNVGINGNRVLFTDSVGVSGEAGAINLNNNDMIVNYTGASVLDDVRQLLKNGYSAGNWNGIGINSASANADATHSTALGFAEASTLLGAGGGTFSGQSVDGTAILIKHTFYGDANLSGNVDTIDFNIVASNFNKTNKIWSDGDFDYQQDVDTIDFNLLASTFGNTGLGPAESKAPAQSATWASVEDEDQNLLI